MISECHVEHFHNILASNIPTLPDEVVLCSKPLCTSHHEAISQFLSSFLDCVSFASSVAFLSVSSARQCTVPGWNDVARDLKNKANFRHRVWLEAGSPSVGVLAQIKKKCKSHYKYAVRSLKERTTH